MKNPKLSDRDLTLFVLGWMEGRYGPHPGNDPVKRVEYEAKIRADLDRNTKRQKPKKTRKTIPRR